MRAKSLILLVVALGCGMIAAVAVSKAVLEPGSGDKVEATVEIFVAVKELPQGQKILAENVKLEKWPKKRVPEGALTQLEEIEEKYADQMIFAGEPILAKKLSDSRSSFSTGVPPGYRIFDIEGQAGYIKPGDHVDILGTFRLGGRNASPESRTVMRNVKVHGINGITTRDSDEDDEKGSRGKNTVFQLLVKESQLEALTLAHSLGEGLQLHLRPFGEDEQDTVDTGASFLSWVNESTEADEPEPLANESQFFTQATSNVSDDDDADKKTMLIVTPNGVRKYEWTEDDEIPQEVIENPDEQPNVQLTNMPTNASGASGNVYSGYGGYSPTYPTSATPSVPAPGGGAQPGGNENQGDSVIQ